MTFPFRRRYERPTLLRHFAHVTIVASSSRRSCDRHQANHPRNPGNKALFTRSPTRRRADADYGIVPQGERRETRMVERKWRRSGIEPAGLFRPPHIATLLELRMGRIGFLRAAVRLRRAELGET